MLNKNTFNKKLENFIRSISLHKRLKDTCQTFFSTLLFISNLYCTMLSIVLFFCCRARKKTHFLFNLDTAPRAMRKRSIEWGNWIPLNHQLVPRIYTTTQPPNFFFCCSWNQLEVSLHIVLLYRCVQKISMGHILGRLEIAYATSKFPIRINQTDHNDNMHL